MTEPDGTSAYATGRDAPACDPLATPPIEGTRWMGEEVPDIFLPLVRIASGIGPPLYAHEADAMLRSWRMRSDFGVEARPRD